jgi:hypothetical protein
MSTFSVKAAPIVEEHGLPEDASLPLEMAERVFSLVGGRIHHLLAFKRNWLRGVPYKETARTLMGREREKFVHASRHPEAWKVRTIIAIECLF